MHWCNLNESIQTGLFLLDVDVCCCGCFGCGFGCCFVEQQFYDFKVTDRLYNYNPYNFIIYDAPLLYYVNKYWGVWTIK